MSVFGDFDFTNASAVPVMIANARLTIYYLWRRFFPVFRRVNGFVMVKDPSGGSDLHDRYLIPPHVTTTGRAHWIVERPIKRPGRALWASVAFIDAYGRPHKTKVLRWPYLG